MTLAELAQVLHPPVSEHQLHLMVQALGIRACGVRKDRRNGRPPRAYRIADIMQLHADVVRWLLPPQAEDPWLSGVALSGSHG